MVTISRYPAAGNTFRYRIIWDDPSGRQHSSVFDTSDDILQFLTLFDSPPEVRPDRKKKRQREAV